MRHYPILNLRILAWLLGSKDQLEPVLEPQTPTKVAFEETSRWESSFSSKRVSGELVVSDHEAAAEKCVHMKLIQ
jgi:hypothetical protein